MFAVADTKKLVSDEVITAEQAQIIERRAREAMITMAVNSVLCFGILAATAGFIVLLAEPLPVAILGLLFLIAGLWVLNKSSADYRIFGNAAALIGAGMLIGGGSVELIDKAEDQAGWVLAIGGALIALICGSALRRGSAAAGFVLGAILITGVALHLGGLGLLLEQQGLFGGAKAAFFLYAAAVVLATGWVTDVRLISALSLVPFAQVLDTGSGYFHAVYVFYSPEPTLTILQMGLLIAGCVLLAQRVPERTARHARLVAVLAFVVANMCALVGSLWGDIVGSHLWGPDYTDFSAIAESNDRWDAYRAARDAFEAKTLVISENLYSLVWALALVGMIFWSAQRNIRGLFNTAMTFGAIHAYTQFFESFADEPAAYVLGGLAAIPLAWGLWRLNQRMAAQES